MTEQARVIPTPDPTTKAYWDAAARHELLIQRCEDCGAYQFLAQFCCRACLSERVEWVQAGGRGEIYSFTVVDRAPTPKFEAQVPYTVALVELAEGVRMMSNVVEIEPRAVRVGMAVEVVFEDLAPGIALPQFRPV